MLFLGIGLLLLLLKTLEIGAVAAWSWWWILSPFALAVAWWAWADASGYTARRVMERMDRRKQARIEKSKDALGTGLRRPGRRR